MKTGMRHIFILLCLFLMANKSEAQTVFPPDLQCVSVDNNGDIVLNWSLPVNACGPFNAYYIYRSLNINGPYSIVYTVLSQFQTSYTDPVSNGASTTYYYYMASDFNCPGALFLNSDTVDNLDPVTPQINYVTVNTGLAQINWQPSSSPEAYGYIIYQVINGLNIPIDTVFGKNNTTYTDFNSTPASDSMSYTLATIDSCINTGLINDFPQHTIFLDDTVLRCSQLVILKWYTYDKWQNGVQQYDINVSTNGGPTGLLKTVGAGIHTDTLQGFNDGDVLCFTIIARENLSTFISTSNEVCVTLNVVQPANNFFIRNVTVIAPNKIAVHYSMDPLADITLLEIERGVDLNSFSTLAQFAPPGDLSVINTYIDSTALTGESSYYYRLIATDSCSAKDTSSLGKSVLLSGYAFSDLSFYITWDESFFDFGKVLSYELSRDDGTGFNPVASLTPDVFVYEEAVTPTTTPCYYIDAIDSMNFPNGIKDTIHSRSNILCLNQPSQIYMPNAFAPLGKNNIFKPILNVQGVKSYSFFVFNRWGEQLFSSSKPADGWDGTFKGRYVPQGAYGYVVNVLDENGKNVQAKGTVLVVR